MEGWKIFTHSLRMVFRNFGAALRISGVLYLVQMAANLALLRRYGPAIEGMQAGQMPPPGFLGASLLAALIAVIAELWVAVAWHRYVLCEERPSTLIPPFKGTAIARYLGNSILIGLMALLAAVIGGVVAGFVGGLLFGVFGVRLFMTIGALGPALYVLYRLSPVLPAVALGRSMSFAQARAATEPANAAIMQLAAIGMALGLVVQIPVFLNDQPASIMGLIYSNVLGWVYMMTGVSILTTIYGHYVEGRDL